MMNYDNLVLELKVLGECLEQECHTCEGNLIHPLVNDAWKALESLRAQLAAAKLPDGWKESVALAHGYLWHVNAGMDAPTELGVLQVTPEQGAYLARKVLRHFLTHDEIGAGINKAHTMLAAAPLPENKP